MKRLILGVAAALLLAGPAVADGLPYKGRIKDIAPPPPSWTGFYIGGGIGAGAVVHDLSLNASKERCVYDVVGAMDVGGGYSTCHKQSFDLNFDGIGGEGVFGTVIIGYDRLLRPGWVGGIFADFDFSRISSDLSVDHSYGYHFNASLDHQHSWSVGARLGMLSNPTTLWYLSAGYTQAEFEFSSSEGSLGVRSPTFQGYFVGGGVESIIHGNWSLRLDYRFTQFDSENVFSYYGVVEGGSRSVDVDLEPSMHTARLLLTYKFGHRD